MKYQTSKTNHFIITNTLEVLIYILLCTLPVVGIMLFTQGGMLFLYIRGGAFFLTLILWGIFSAIDIFKTSKSKAILRLILILAFAGIFGYIAYVSYVTTPHL